MARIVRREDSWHDAIIEKLLGEGFIKIDAIHFYECAAAAFKSVRGCYGVMVLLIDDADGSSIWVGRGRYSLRTIVETSQHAWNLDSDEESKLIELYPNVTITTIDICDPNSIDRMNKAIEFGVDEVTDFLRSPRKDRANFARDNQRQ